MSVVLCLFAVTAVYGQRERVAIPGAQLSVEEVIESIRQQTDYLFAFDGRAFDVTRTVRAPSMEASVEELVELITAGTDFSWLSSGTYIVIHRSNRQEPPSAKPEPKPRTSDVYTPSDPDADTFEANPRKPARAAEQESGPAVPADPEVSSDAIPNPFSAYRNPDTYFPVSRSLPRGAIKTDMLYGVATLTPNIGLEWGLDMRSTLEFTWGWNQRNHEGARNGNKKLNHGLARFEYRRWFCERYLGHFVGVHLFGTKYNVGGYDIPTLFKRQWRYEGWALGAGLTYGYSLALARRWSLEFQVGVGVARYNHTRFECVRCGASLERPSGFWFGPTRAGVDLVFMLWK